MKRIMSDKSTETQPVLWSPLLVGIMTFLILPGGWMLGTLNFYRAGLKLRAAAHFISLLVLTFLSFDVVFSAHPDELFGYAFLLGLTLSYYMYNINSRMIYNYRVLGGVVQTANPVTGVLISIAATLGWGVFVMILAVVGASFQMKAIGFLFP